MSKKRKLFYDFHLHSCLSPCGDIDMTPNNIINMVKLKGLDIIALTDHNSCKNCESAMKVGEKVGLEVLPGMELCTAEDIHVVCLFRTLSGALSFEKIVEERMQKVPNRPDIFGEELILDENDNVVSKENNLLIVSSNIPINSVLPLARSFGGTAFPAHCDKISNGIIAILGAIPEEAGFSSCELSPLCDDEKFIKENPSLLNKHILKNSDAHYLENISEPENYLENLECSADSVITFLDTFKSK